MDTLKKSEPSRVGHAHEASGRRSTFYVRDLILRTLASILIFGGISSAASGTICTVLHAMLSKDTMFSQVGSVLLIAAIPAMLVGSLFMDKMDG